MFSTPKERPARRASAWVSSKPMGPLTQGLWDTEGLTAPSAFHSFLGEKAILFPYKRCSGIMRPEHPHLLIPVTF